MFGSLFLFLTACVSLSPAGSVVASLLSRSLLWRASFALLSSQLLSALPLTAPLVGEGSALGGVLQPLLVALTFALTPQALLQSYAALVGCIGPLLAVACSIALLRLTRRVSRYWSRRIGECETSDEDDRGYKALILVTGAVGYLLALRWLYLSEQDSAALTVGTLLQLLCALVLCGLFTYSTLRLRRGVISESAVACALLALSYYRFRLASLSADELAARRVSDAGWSLLDSWLPAALDALALLSLLLDLHDAAQPEQRAAVQKNASSLLSSAPLVRGMLLLFLTHYFATLVDDATKEPKSDWWSATLEAVTQRLPEQAIEWGHAFSQHATSALDKLLSLSAAGLTATPSAAESPAGDAWSTLTAAYTLPTRLSALARGLTVCLYFGRQLRRDQQAEEEGHEHED